MSLSLCLDQHFLSSIIPSPPHPLPTKAMSTHIEAPLRMGAGVAASTKPEPAEVESGEYRHGSRIGRMSPETNEMAAASSSSAAAAENDDAEADFQRPKSSSSSGHSDGLRIMTWKGAKDRDSTEEMVCVCTPVKQPPRPPNCKLPDSLCL